MKDLEDLYKVTPVEFSRAVPKLGNWDHAGGTSKPIEIFDDFTFLKRINERLTKPQIQYVKSLVNDISQKVKDNSHLRMMLTSKMQNFAQFETYEVEDIWILKRIFL